jgi:hypothetical protein
MRLDSIDSTDRGWVVSKSKFFLISAGAFALGMSLCIYASRLAAIIFPLGAETAEETRVTSPDGNLDAVILMEAYGGAVGGINSYVYIVRKGRPVPTHRRNPLLEADPFHNAKLVWKQSHLLEIHYDVAHIYDYRNFWALDEIEDVGPRGEREFYVEVRLVPSSPDFSLLTPEGGFRRTY